MGKATDQPSEQMKYIKNRIKMLHEVADSMDEQEAGSAELEQLSRMLKDLQIKIERFQKDWQA
ncbi:hypothetical protein GCM10007216_38220 [Thalassobacillus devorans]|uniref:Uncharacterized protein n=1 Tax=Thalassobacillus devorans TaxID=279813 RepID=A0ABQ1PUB8_9BACI|nr:SE1561 family protein [Thalassobacillus devorans]NIK29534.1 hypothetical protein [Thalassobacillus devorans]GGD03933.1 hypothetical protein GCM10007216_38220 [Thalassobacillus devorans]